MKARGSITIFFTLILSVLFSMMGSLLLSAKVAAGRALIATAVDQTMYSAMAKYDRQLFDEYHLLYIDGSYGSGTLQLGKTLDEMEEDLSYLLTPNKDRWMTKGISLVNLEKTGGGISGYTLATDCHGQVFWEQVVSYMEDTLGLQGILLLTQKLREENGALESQKTVKKQVEENGTIDEYEKIKKEAQEAEKEDTTQKTEGLDDLQETENSEKEEIDEETRKKGEEAESVMDAVTQVKKTGLLSLVTGENQQISNWSAEKNQMLRNRKLQEGMGYLELTNENPSMTEDLLFQEYLMKNMNCYSSQKHETGPAYGIELIIFGNSSDVKNLESAVNGMFWAREAANTAALYKDKSRYEQVEIMASALAAVLELPGAELIFKGALTLAWAYVESVVDVSAMLSGKEVPLIKQSDQWQVEFVEILSALQSPESFYQEGQGMDYEDYLRLLLLTKTKEERIYGCMEVIELSMREIQGKEQFAMDCAIDSLTGDFDISVQNFKTFTITESRSYRKM